MIAFMHTHDVHFLFILFMVINIINMQQYTKDIQTCHVYSKHSYILLTIFTTLLSFRFFYLMPLLRFCIDISQKFQTHIFFSQINTSSIFFPPIIVVKTTINTMAHFRNPGFLVGTVLFQAPHSIHQEVSLHG